MSDPLVSVVIAAWNAAPFLPATLASVFGQTWTHLEIIVVDDGSTDGTAEVVAPLRSKVRYEQQGHRGLAAARNNGLSLAGGEYVALLDADDLWHPEKIARQVDVARRHPEAGLIACDAEEFTDHDVRRGSLFPSALSAALAARGGEVTADFHRELIEDCGIACPAQTLIPRPVIDRVGAFIDSGAQDYDYYLRLSQHYPMTLDRQVLARWRFRGDSMSGPPGHRRIRWALDSLPVLCAHRQRCRPEHRRDVDGRISRLVLSLAVRLAIHGGPVERRRARVQVSRLLHERRWSAVRLTALTALRAMDLGDRTRTAVARGFASGAAARPHRPVPRSQRTRVPWGEAGRVERHSEDLDRLIPDDACVVRIAHGFGFTEGPVWLPDGVLLFGDLSHNVIWRWSPSEGVSVMRPRSGYGAADRPPLPSMGSNGMALDSAGRLTVCEPGNRRITRTEPDGTIVVVASHYEGRRLNSPNDLVYRRVDGSLYFTDPPHGLPLEDEDLAKELPVNGAYRLRDGRVELLVDDLTRPNGLAFSPDDRTLYVSNSDPDRKIWMRYDVGQDGSLARGSVLLDLTHEPGQAPDGLEVDAEGNLYLTGPGGIWIVSAAGVVLGVIRTRIDPSNVTWGGADRRDLYITARAEVYRIRTAVGGTLGSSG